MHDERCLSANRFGPSEDFECVCRKVEPVRNGERPAELLLADVAQIAFTECQDPLEALARIRGLLDPKRASGLGPELQR